MCQEAGRVTDSGGRVEAFLRRENGRGTPGYETFLSRCGDLCHHLDRFNGIRPHGTFF
jgi:hypothetical protein